MEVMVKLGIKQLGIIKKKIYFYEVIDGIDESDFKEKRQEYSEEYKDAINDWENSDKNNNGNLVQIIIIVVLVVIFCIIIMICIWDEIINNLFYRNLIVHEDEKNKFDENEDYIYMEVRGGKYNGNLTILYSNNNTMYKGEFRNNHALGWGTFFYRDENLSKKYQ